MNDESLVPANIFHHERNMLYLSLSAGAVYIQTSGRESPALSEHILLRGDIVDDSLEEVVENREEKDRKEVRRRRAFSRGVFCTIIETERSRRFVLSEEVILELLGVKVASWNANDCPQQRFVNARNPDLKNSE